LKALGDGVKKVVVDKAKKKTGVAKKGKKKI